LKDCKERLLGFDENKSGTLKYAPPKLFQSGVYNTRKMAVWSLGILPFVMARGKFPYASSDHAIVRRLIFSGWRVRPQQIEPELKEL
jgi:serine/threonine protein kinase